MPREFTEELQPSANAIDVQMAQLPGDDRLEIGKVTRAPCHHLIDDQVLGRACAQADTWLECECRRSIERFALEIKGGERDVQIDAVGGSEEQNSIRDRKFPGISPARLEPSQQRIEHARLAPVLGEDGRIDVTRQTRLTPTRDSQAANQAGRESEDVEGIEEFVRGCEERIHRARDARVAAENQR